MITSIKSHDFRFLVHEKLQSQCPIDLSYKNLAPSIGICQIGKRFLASEAYYSAALMHLGASARSESQGFEEELEC